MALFDGIAERVEQQAQRVAQRALDLAETAAAEFPNIMVRREGDELVFEGRGLLRRWMSDVRLRFALWAPSTSFAGPPPRAGEDLR